MPLLFLYPYRKSCKSSKRSLRRNVTFRNNVLIDEPKGGVSYRENEMRKVRGRGTRDFTENVDHSFIDTSEEDQEIFGQESQGSH